MACEGRNGLTPVSLSYARRFAEGKPDWRAVEWFDSVDAEKVSDSTAWI
jgi:hypothetical protein